ncbi:MAG: ABC transporter substrate-binding protein, partial [bacterium]
LDQYTVRFTFPESNPLFIRRLATATNSQVVAYPRHYLKRFHGDLADADALSRRAREVGFNSWYDLFEDKAHGRNPELPRLTAWVMTQPPPATPIVFERNPYYWKVDPDGRQLPYIGRVTYEIVSKGLFNLKIISGEVDMQTRHVELRHYPLLMENRAAGGYQVRRWHASSNGSVLMPNMNHKDPVLAELFQDRRVRRALSHAIDREAINELIYFGLGTPAQMAPHPISRYARPEYATQHLAYDPALANRLLDAAGLAERNEQRLRLRPDGRPLSLTLESFDLIADPETMQMIARNWRAVGIDARMRQFARSLFYTRVEARMHEVAAGGNDSIMLPEQDEGYLLPAHPASRHAPDWADWYRTRGQAGEAPPLPMRRIMNTHRRMRTTRDSDQRTALLHEILADNAEQLWTIGLISNLPAPVIVDNRFRNVPTESVFYNGLAFTQPACYAIEAN